MLDSQSAPPPPRIGIIPTGENTSRKEKVSIFTFPTFVHLHSISVLFSPASHPALPCHHLPSPTAVLPITLLFSHINPPTTLPAGTCPCLQVSSGKFRFCGRYEQLCTMTGGMYTLPCIFSAYDIVISMTTDDNV